MARALMRFTNVLTVGTNLGMLAADYINPKPTPRKSPIKSKMKGGTNTYNFSIGTGNGDDASRRSKSRVVNWKPNVGTIPDDDLDHISGQSTKWLMPYTAKAARPNAKPKSKGGSKSRRSVRRNRSPNKTMNGGAQTYSFTITNDEGKEVTYKLIVKRPPHMFSEIYSYALAMNNNNNNIIDYSPAERFAESITMSHKELELFISEVAKLTPKTDAHKVGLTKLIKLLKPKLATMIRKAIEEDKFKKERASNVLRLADSSSPSPDLKAFGDPKTLQDAKRRTLTKTLRETRPKTPDPVNKITTATDNINKEEFPIETINEDKEGGSNRRRSVRRKCKRCSTRRLRR